MIASISNGDLEFAVLLLAAIALLIWIVRH